VDSALAAQRLDEALALAMSDEPLPAEWIERAAQVGRAASRSYVPMLGTALLAKATDDHLSALALKESAGHNAYSARGVAHQVLVPFARRHRINLRTTGSEPLNNQPFFRYSVVSREMQVRGGTRDELDYLVGTLERVDFLRSDGALRALAAFLRVRLNDPATEFVDLELTGRLHPAGLVATTERFVVSDPEGGRRGQAFAAAALDLVFEQVDSRRVNDPSRTWPGDVRVVAPGNVATLHVEVRQKPVSDDEVAQYAQRLVEAGVERGAVFALHPHQADLGALEHEHLAAGGRLPFRVFRGVALVLRSALFVSRFSLDEALDRFPREMLRQLHLMESAAQTLDNWRREVQNLSEQQREDC
jgi:hypothetical protein